MGPTNTRIDNATIRSSSHAELAAYFRTLLLHQQTPDNDDYWKPISDHLLAGTVSGAISPEAFCIWVNACKRPDAVVAAMAQNVSTSGRRTAIKRFGRLLRTDAGFAAIWAAVGGAEGTMALMAQMSTNEVDLLCMAIRRSSTAPGAKRPRQEAMSALFRALQGVPGAPKNPDPRPLSSAHRSITSACSADIALRGVDLTHCLPGNIRYHAHTAEYEAHAMEAMFPGDGGGEGKGEGDGQEKPISAFVHLMERSPSFSIRVLQRMILEKTLLTAEEGKSVIEVTKSLLKRLSRRRGKGNPIKEQAVRLIAECVQKYPILAGLIECAGPRDLISSAINVWNRVREPATRARLEESIIVLVAMVPKHTLGKIGCITTWTESVPLSLRPRLMRLLLLHAQKFQVDIESQTPENDERLRGLGPWPAKAFLVLPAEKGLELFEYMLKLRPDGSFLQTKLRSDGVILEGDLDQTSTLLRTRVFGTPEHDAEWYEKTGTLIAELKKDAASAREWEDRSRFAGKALSLCVEMGSLDHYEDIILWSRRFRRDPHTVHNFHNSQGFTSGGYNLLSGIPPKRSGSATSTNTAKAKIKGTPWIPVPGELSVSIEQVHSNVLKANNIMLHLLETAIEALREPSFSRRDWGTVLRLPVFVIQRRLANAHAIQEYYQFSEGTLYENIWKPTIDFLVKFERLSLESGHERLELLDLAGPFVGLLTQIRPETPHPATYAFLNELAQRRDGLWREVRLRDHPSVASLASPWPRGLPVQFLCAETHWEHIPYVQARAEQLVFADGPSVLEPIPEDEELREAIGPFVESYKYALEVYIQSGTSDEDRYARIKRAWQHAVTKLVDPAMSEKEVPRFWRKQFTHVVVTRLELDFPYELAPIRAPPIPEFPHETGEGPSEWNPEPNFGADQEPPKELPPTYLSAMLSQEYRSRFAKKTSDFDTPVVSTIGSIRPHIFNRFGAVQNAEPLPDSVIAAALSYTNTKYGSDTSFLLHPFPSRTETRYPTFYLDQEFLDLVSKNTDWSTVVLICQAAPTPILVRLAESLIARLAKDPAGDGQVRYVAVNITKRISQSDHPAAACGLIQKVVLDLPGDSSWHRHLLGVSFLRRLPAKEARAFFSSLSSQLRDRLLAQWSKKSREDKGQEKEEIIKTEDETTKKEDSDGSYVKVTTVKLVAQMLRDASYVDQAFACEILVNLLTTIKQGDIQIAAIDSLISMLGSGGPQKDPAVDAVVFDAIERYVVPIAASLNEKEPLPVEEWQNDKKPPRVYGDGAFEDFPPILDLLVQARRRWKLGTASRHEWVSRVLVPVVEQSAANNHQWIKIFVAHHGLDIDVDSLPRLPVRPALLLDLFGEPEFYTRANFETLKRYTWTVLQMPEHQRNLKAFEEDRKKRPNGKQEAAQWLHLWPASISKTGCAPVVRQLQKTAASLPSTDAHDRPSPQRLASFLLEVAEYVIEEAQPTKFDYLVGAVGTMYTKTAWLAKGPSLVATIGAVYSKDAWLANCLPLLEEMVGRVDKRRTDEAWQRNLDRKPATLPDTFPVKLRILEERYTPINNEPLNDDSIFSEFAADVSSLINELIGASSSSSSSPASYKPYHETWPTLQSKVIGVFRTSEADSLRAALALAPAPVAVQNKLSLAELLRVELVDQMIRKRSGRQDPGLVRGVRALLRSWTRSPVEWVRTRGVETAGMLRKRAELELAGNWFGAQSLDEEEGE